LIAVGVDLRGLEKWKHYGFSLLAFWQSVELTFRTSSYANYAFFDRDFKEVCAPYFSGRYLTSFRYRGLSDLRHPASTVPE
jgi:hypothetical protein